ncbi:MAG: hypothetical protein ACK554_00800, partial [Erythrobacteraceae bacterium]
AVIGAMLANHTHRPFTDFRRKLVPGLAHNESSFSQIGASRKPGAVHLLFYARAEYISLHRRAARPLPHVEKLALAMAIKY